MTLEGRNILLVEDDQITTFYVTRMFQKERLDVNLKIASNGQEAINYFISTMTDTSAKPSLIFLDLNMPVMDGWEFLEEMKKLDAAQLSGTHVAICTSSDSFHDIEKANAYSVVKEYITKPMNTDILINMINKYLDGNFQPSATC
jgi:CheY-like chemotaxis protein